MSSADSQLLSSENLNNVAVTSSRRLRHSESGHEAHLKEQLDKVKYALGNNNQYRMSIN